MGKEAMPNKKTVTTTGVDLHAMKQETFHIDEALNIDNKGFHRPTEKLERHQFGDHTALYMARTADNPNFHYLESWLLPGLMLRVNRFRFRPGYKETQDLYIDVASITAPLSDATPWHVTDLYVDVVTHHDGRVETLDLDELAAAMEADLVPHTDAIGALVATQQLLDGATEFGSVDAWLRSQGIELHWRY